MLTLTRSPTPTMLNKLPPYSGMRLSTSVTCAPNSTRRRARLEPIKPSPPVMRMFRPSKVLFILLFLCVLSERDNPDILLALAPYGHGVAPGSGILVRVPFQEYPYGSETLVGSETSTSIPSDIHTDTAVGPPRKTL